MDLSEFLNAVVSLIRQSQRPVTGVNAAYLGSLIRSRAGIDWQKYGFLRLSDVLNKLQAEGRVRLTVDSKGSLTVFTADAPTAPAATATLGPIGLSTRNVASPSERALKKPVWNAFVTVWPPHRRLLNARTGEAWITPEPPPPPTEDWKPVEVIPADEQRRWAREFLTTVGLGDDREIADALAREDWFRVFPLLLASKRDASIVRAWNRKRSEQVIRRVDAWATQHGVQLDMLFEDFKRLRVEKPSVAVGDDLRLALLEALNRVSVDDLLSLPIPARHLVAVIRPDLLRER